MPKIGMGRREETRAKVWKRTHKQTKEKKKEGFSFSCFPPSCVFVSVRPDRWQSADHFCMLQCFAALLLINSLNAGVTAATAALALA